MVRRLAGFFGVTKKQIIKFDQKEWRENAQSGEFQFHLNNKWRQSDDFMEQTIKLFDYFGFARNDYQNKTIIDLGAGSRLRSKYFTGANIIAIEPLADKFIEEIMWCDLSDALAVYSIPAERRINQCLNVADLVVSINVLDHCYDFELIIGNISAYLTAGGLAFLSFDKHEFPDKMHPLLLDEQICNQIFTQNHLTIEKFTTGAGRVLTTYGHGPYCLNYWLRKVSSF
jgi:2-polyprenyl-3-methyl-5-hydroxy-6-metoxy-1,4-benzoquinol methylase